MQERWIRRVSTMCLGFILLAVGAVWTFPADLAAANGRDLAKAIGGCASEPCHYTSACANTNDGYNKDWVKSTYFYYKSGSAQLVAPGPGTVGNCRVHKHYSQQNCGGSDYIPGWDWLVDIGC